MSRSLPAAQNTGNKFVTVLYFAAAQSATGLHTETIPFPDTSLTLGQLARLLAERHPALQDVLNESSWSVDAEMIDDERDVNEVYFKGGEEVAVICPVSGGVLLYVHPREQGSAIDPEHAEEAEDHKHCRYIAIQYSRHHKPEDSVTPPHQPVTLTTHCRSPQVVQIIYGINSAKTVINHIQLRPESEDRQ
ncbi:uncharacterized protein EI90DRAFT_3079235 [Cantharellus anzutake]|uniref:uncharacterized protein n=1 Tax=Cantharellus anzutake TaxID=1750568 RepID=UPI0019040775|nr:uncharacterized protein EI90DRAFT_3079235 [Cantharellus anzutake]KAF8321388.1 hypothetical protein EI90DRAFT_3079235 [Cantharellus anzutake]